MIYNTSSIMSNNDVQQQVTRRRRALVATIGVLLATVGSVGGFTTSLSSGRRMTMKLADLTRKTKSKPVLSSRGASGIPAASALSMICEDQQEFEMKVGHAMDVLRTDYPNILTCNPDFSIYDKDLEVIDPSGVKLHGLSNYKNSFRLLHAIVNIFYCPERSTLTFRMCFDKARQNIRIHWNAQVIPKAIFGGYKTTLHVDGISVYEISRNSGNITQHRVERLVINDAAVMPEEGIFSGLRRYAAAKDVSIPIYNSAGVPEDNQMVEFQNFQPMTRPLLFQSNDESSSSSPSSSAVSSSSSALSSSADDIDCEALERKNAYRKKFGLDALSPEEFMELQDQVAEMDSQQRLKRTATATAAAEMAKKSQEAKEPGFLKKLFGNLLEDTCESNYDCQDPQVCCDFGFKKTCCSSGMLVFDGPKSQKGQLAVIPVTANPNNYPPKGPGGDGYPNYPRGY